VAKLRVLLTGASGQLGQALQAKWPKCYELVALNHSDFAVEDIEQGIQIFMQYKPHMVIHCAAFTAVDRAQIEPDLAYDINEQGVRNLVRICQKKRIKLLHISSDYVYQGEGSTALIEQALPNPSNEYGHSKLAGDNAVLALGKQALVLRSSWLFSPFGQNFVKSLWQKLRAGERVRVVNDQIGSPTSALYLADCIIQAIAPFWRGQISGLFHVCNQGQASWFELAQALEKLARARGFTAGQVEAISTAEYCALQQRVIAPRPAFSVLDGSALVQALGVEQPAWKQALAECVALLD
jgi:dTDP-4-dehydrorhamnose reductase